MTVVVRSSFIQISREDLGWSDSNLALACWQLVVQAGLTRRHRVTVHGTRYLSEARRRERDLEATPKSGGNLEGPWGAARLKHQKR
jgi:hypothetical protein